jgi:TatD-related deoxyribonuclease
MSTETNLSFADAHLHTNPVKGLGAEKVAKLMIEKNLWFAAIVSLPHWDYGIELKSMEDYRKIFDIHIRECLKAKQKGLVVSCFAGLHPAEIDRLIDKGMPHERVFELSVQILDFLFKSCEEGIIQGVGEVGRQHYNVRPDKALIAQLVLEHAIMKSNQHDCLLQLHMENIKGFTAWSMKLLLEKINGKKNLIIFHHMKPGVIEDVNKLGFFTTTPAHIDSLEVVFKRSDINYLLIESDYTDEPSSERNIIEPWRIPDIEKELASRGIIGLDELYKINIDNVEKAFDVKY